MAKMKPFPVSLSDEHRIILEKLKAKNGASSVAEVIRKLIVKEDKMQKLESISNEILYDKAIDVEAKIDLLIEKIGI